MTLISLLLVLLVERITTKSQYWQAGFYADKYLENIESRGWFNSSSKSWVLTLVIFVPVMIIYLIVQKFAGGLVELVISTAILMVCVGCPAIRATYKCFLQAANKGDSQACDMYEDQISGDDKDTVSFGLNLVWQNYRHYTAVILWFAACGAAGAIFYILVREMGSKFSNDNIQVANKVKRLLNIVVWIPVRITALGFV